MPTMADLSSSSSAPVPPRPATGTPIVVLKPTRGEHFIACFEAAKGALVLLAGFGILSLMHIDIQRFAKAFVDHLHLAPRGMMADIFLRVGGFSGHRLLLLAIASYAYAALRFIEAYGLWRARRWAKWVAVVGGLIYVPYEVYEVVRHVTPIKCLALLLNLAIVAYMGYSLWRANRVTALAVA
jgi:uncharacterized membrane protein (DUF2068 family)